MRCPICKKAFEEPRGDQKNSTYPFCSERCKLIDLGRWLDGAYQIPIASDDKDESNPSPATGEDD